MKKNKSKYDKYRVNGFDDSSEGFLTKGQIEFLLEDEKKNQEKILLTDEYLDFIYNNSSKIKTSEHNKSLKVFPAEEEQHPLGKEGLERAYKNLKNIQIDTDDLDSIS